MTSHDHPSVSTQVERLVELGVSELAGITAEQLRELAASLPVDVAVGRPLLAIHPSFVPAAQLVSLLRREGRAGFVVVDMTDLAEFTPTDDLRVPDAPLYVVGDVTRDDDMLGWTPTDAHAEFARRGRTPLTISEGVSWLLQQPGMLEPGRCFMCIGSRKRKADGALDARTPALWISGGTGRDGRERKGAPKVGWCWANNHHTWLGFASTAGRVGPGLSPVDLSPVDLSPVDRDPGAGASPRGSAPPGRARRSARRP
ncbi:hypothetical protein H483_0116090 [Dietzia sp. UCD-THP]|uniref:DUF5701 family protein n=1 Tax=Dietzia sp. UCD-THP TaxID=1292020 RepID=UPI000437A436|nr:DUF5701 family protein [Dietzia sp. UCD-THP]EYT57026.1 hypothetical protein H483_0116090 [Dietzia sp. UCD-THP]